MLATFLRTLPLRTFIVIAVVAGGLSGHPRLASAQISTIPSASHYAGLQQLYEGEYRNALRTFNREVRTGGVKSGIQAKWVDSICYHAMLGETLFHYGRLADALDQFDLACSLYLQHPQWLLRVNFDNAPPRPVSTLRQQGIPWGVSNRQATPAQFTSSMLVQIGRIDNSQQVRQGGLVQQAQYWKVDVVEIIRCTTLAMRRRNELLGPLGKYNALSKELSTELIRPGAPPNHWSNAWLELLRGIAHAGVGEKERARQYLSRAVLLMGQYDHPLTCVALLAQGELALDAGDAAAADALFAEASYSAYQYEDLSTIDEAFRLAEFNRLASGVETINPALQPAANWARTKRFDHVYARLSLAMCDELLQQRQWPAAAAALKSGQSRLEDARGGLLGVLSANLEAQLEFHSGRDSGPAKLAAALNLQQAASIWNFQISLANAMFDSQALPASGADEVYGLLLRDPSAADVAGRPRDALAVMKTPHDDAFSRWLTALLERRDIAGALEVSDRAKRRRYHQALPWGGRLAALRDLATTPANQLPIHARPQQGALLAQYPALQSALDHELQVRQEIDQAWQPGIEEEQQIQLGRMWQTYADAVRAREALLRQISLQRVPADMSFPPVAGAKQLQGLLRPGQAVLAFHDTQRTLFGFLFTADASIAWDCGPSSLLQRKYIEPLLRELGNYDANHELTPEQLTDDQWQKAGLDLYQALLGDSSLDPVPLTDLIVVPDGPVWYVPFEALTVKTETEQQPFLNFTRIRYAPTIGLALSNDRPFRRVGRTGVVAGDLIPGDSEESKQAVMRSIDAALTHAIRLSSPLPTDSTLMASLLDQLIVFEDVVTEGPDPLGWAPLPLDRSDSGGSLLAWTALAHQGPQRVFLPGMHTAAERGGRVARRRGSTTVAGADLFFASCGLMAAGAETTLLSRWRVGGQTSLELVREFAQELPHAPASEAWQRAVSVVRATPIDPLGEPRIKEIEEGSELTADHPFFWAGYLVVDSGWAPKAEEENGENGEGERDGTAPPAMPDEGVAAVQAADASKPAAVDATQSNEPKVPAPAEPDADLSEVNDAIGIPAPPSQSPGK